MRAFIEDLLEARGQGSNSGSGDAPCPDLEAKRLRAASGLLQASITFGLAHSLILAKDPRADGLYRDLLVMARTLIREGGSLDHALDVDPSIFPATTLIGHLLRPANTSDIQILDCRAAGSQMALIDDALTYLLDPETAVCLWAALPCLVTLQELCLGLPERMITQHSPSLLAA